MWWLLALILTSCSALAATPNETIEQLIAEAWQPLDVRVEWEFRKSSRQDLEPGIEYSITQPRPVRLTGNLTLKLAGLDVDGHQHTIPVSGKAKIFGHGFTVSEYVSAGETIKTEQIIAAELEWTRVNGQPLTELDTESEHVAARGLVPGRTICMNDLRATPVVLKDQPVTLELSDDSIIISLAGRALKDGAVGDEIPVSVELEHTKRYRGVVVDKSTVRFIQ